MAATTIGRTNLRRLCRSLDRACALLRARGSVCAALRLSFAATGWRSALARFIFVGFIALSMRKAATAGY